MKFGDLLVVDDVTPQADTTLQDRVNRIEMILAAANVSRIGLFSCYC